MIKLIRLIIGGAFMFVGFLLVAIGQLIRVGTVE